MKYSIQVGLNNKILRSKSEKIINFNKSLKKVEKELIKFMEKYDGIGIAAPQIGINLQIIICTLNKKIITFCNPKILSLSEDCNLDEEGCLSLPQVFGQVKRSKEISLEYQDINGKVNRMNFKGLNARILQHETDHLNGILFYDKIEGKPDFGKNIDFEKVGISQILVK